jgi:hypothetical protein
MLGTASKRQSGAGGMKPASSSATAGTPQDGRDNSASPSEAVHQPSESRMTRIAWRAHEIYEARGGAHGKAMEDWLQAEREVDAEIENSAGERLNWGIHGSSDDRPARWRRSSESEAAGGAPVTRKRRR